MQQIISVSYLTNMHFSVFSENKPFLDWQGSYTNITAGISTAYSDIDTTDNVQDVRSPRKIQM